MLKKLALVAALALGGASAQAVTVTSMGGGAVPAHQRIIADFDSPAPGVAYSGSYTISSASVSGFAAAPYGDTTKYFATPSITGGPTGVATVDMSGFVSLHGSLKKVSFYWGSIDNYNRLALIGTGLTGQTTFFGTDINNPANGNQSSLATNRTVTFTLGAGEKLTGLQLSSGSRAFEIDNISGTVPEPASWAMLLTGFGLIGVGMRRRSRAVAA